MSERHHGILSRWNEERGFGFIAPESDGEDVFVHVTAFPRGQKPVLGEHVSFEIETAPNGKKRAARVILPNSLRLTPVIRRQSQTTSHRADSTRAMPTPRRVTRSQRQRRGFPLGRVLLLACVLAAGAFGYKEYQKRGGQPYPLLEIPAMARPTARPVIQESPRFQCDGRQHCSQMRSCDEAKFFLRNCPNTKMDGDRDGVPCEDQLCRGW